MGIGKGFLQCLGGSLANLGIPKVDFFQRAHVMQQFDAGIGDSCAVEVEHLQFIEFLNFRKAGVGDCSLVKLE